MKKQGILFIIGMIILITLFGVVKCAIGQTYITTDYKIVEQYNNVTEEFDSLYSMEYISFFEINKDVTMIIHTDKEMSSLYKVIDSRYDAKYDCIELDVISDVGNQYTLMLAYQYNNISFIFKDENGILYLIILNIKSKGVK